jgi:hypothetical protein
MTSERGFTVPEVFMSLILTALLSGLIFMFTINYWRFGYMLEADLDTFVSRLNAGDYLRENIGPSSGLINQNGLPDVNTNNPDPSIPSNLYWQPLNAVPGSFPVGNNGTTTPLLYFKKPSMNSAGDIIMNGQQPFEDEYILYMDGGNKQLRVRTLANPNATGNRLRTSCPSNVATGTCPADRIIMEDLASVELRYFSRSANLIDFTSSTDPETGLFNGPDFPVAEVVEFTLNVEKRPIFQKENVTKSSTIIRVALRNT